MAKLSSTFCAIYTIKIIYLTGEFKCGASIEFFAFFFLNCIDFSHTGMI